MAGSKHTGSGGSVVYLSISNGKLVQRVNEPTEDSVTRVNKTGKTVHEVFWKDWSGTIAGIERVDGEYGSDWRLTLDDGQQRAVIQFQVGSRYATEFAKRVPNITPGFAIRFMPWQMDGADGKKKSGVAVYQNRHGVPGQEQKVEPYYTRESAEQMPQLKQVKVSGKVLWDSTELDEFVAGILNTLNLQPPAPDANPAQGGEEVPF